MAKIQALGLVESRGFVGVTEAADAMAKAAQVEVVGYEHVGGGYACAIVRGEVAAVRAAVEAGAQAAKEVGEFIGSHVIPRPHEQLEKVLPIVKARPARKK
jgi:ethanolamine utilization protein EutM